MAIDFAAVQAALAQAEVEANEAKIATEELTVANEAQVAAQALVTEKIAAQVKENDERVASIQAVIALLSAGL